FSGIVLALSRLFPAYLHPMKRILLPGLLCCLIVFGLSSCEKTDDGDISGNDREKFLGDWLGQSTGSVQGSINFNMTITASNSAPDQVLFENFDGYGSGTFIPATVSGSDFSFIRTIISGDTIEGSGRYNSNNTLSFSFTVRDGQTVDTRSGTARRP
ncbi:MAG: hypothetical protein ACO1HD_13905, partial [Bacteroidota bacterium]